MSKINVNSTGINEGGINVKGDTKKNTKITISIGSVVIIVFAIWIFISSSNNIEKKIIGTWQIDEQPQIYVTFGENSTFSMSGDGDYLEGNYTFLGDNTVQAHMSYLWADFVLTGDISISGSKMTISNMSDPDDIFGADGITLNLTKTN